MVDASLEVIAHHEAGHAVAATIRSLPFDYVSIIPDDETHGHMRHCPWLENFNPEWDSDPEQMEYMETRIICALSGPAAEKHFTGEYNDAGAEGDNDWAIDLIMCIAGSQQQVQDQYDGATDQAAKLVNDNWPAVEALAKALLEEREITGQRARDIIKTALMESEAIDTK